MENQIPRLGEWARQTEKRQERIESKLDALASHLKAVDDHIKRLPTRDDLWNWKLQWVVIGITAIILVVSLVFGGMSLFLSVIQG